MGYLGLSIFGKVHIHTHSPAMHFLQVADPLEALIEAYFGLGEPILALCYE
jgi:hypothetical protein